MRSEMGIVVVADGMVAMSATWFALAVTVHGSDSPRRSPGIYPVSYCSHGEAM